MNARSPLIVGNWKMNGRRDSLEQARAVREGLAAPGAGRPEAVLCPPAPYLAAFAAALPELTWGAQDVDPRVDGAHTGDISAEMLADAGARFVIVGHSERRADHAETDQRVRAKAQALLRAGLTPIVCVGETMAQRQAGQAGGVISRQAEASAPGLDAIIAYEPLWAIGSGQTPRVDEIEEVHRAIRAALGPVRILYGGSVKPANAAEILAIEGVDGALVGGASLKAADFLAIVRACPRPG